MLLAWASQITCVFIVHNIKYLNPSFENCYFENSICDGPTEKVIKKYKWIMQNIQIKKNDNPINSELRLFLFLSWTIIIVGWVVTT